MKTKRRQQFGALPFRKNRETVDVLLVTSRDTGRWVIPKGWPMRGKRPHRAAGIEAFEEAGVVGKPGKKPIGQYDYDKRVPGGAVPCRVVVFPLPVDELTEEWPEMEQRHREWHAADRAADLVAEPELQELLRTIQTLL
ncbi:NUDIX hydrolase [Jiella sonneratiae]|uniref:NUDIX hydrolase n=1 Tax=Jiella sonneratiae TaxID=2816856 RepID=A0ABS3J8R0_9HYPH|nr:NUDIX hydrolase [Jiella sonneratiae]MBO0906058.1 NUDIX hydrolase [Jiella sonneratiae]